MGRIDERRWAGIAHKILVTTERSVHHLPRGQWAWQIAYRAASRRWSDEEVATRLHGHNAVINFANPYPIIARRFPNYNAPQVEVVEATAEALGRHVVVVDIGAAVGDTALMLLERAPSLDRLYCVEGEARFAQMLRTNLTDPRARVFEAMLSDGTSQIASLVRHHEGTASAQGDDRVEATTLDELLRDIDPDVVKIDTDGFDGNILAGAVGLLRRARPSVLFEWHPGLAQNVGSNPLLAFEILASVGYSRWVWFTKFGQFGHFGADNLEQYLRLCETTNTLFDWHYDVVALHGESLVDEVAVADLRHWGNAGW